MTDDLVITLCVGVFAIVLVGLGACCGFAWGHHLGTLDVLRVPRGTSK